MTNYSKTYKYGCSKLLFVHLALFQNKKKGRRGRLCTFWIIRIPLHCRREILKVQYTSGADRDDRKAQAWRLILVIPAF